MLNAKDLIREQSSTGTPEHDFGALSFEAFLGNLLMPHIRRFDLRGWCYAQHEMQQFLVRHAATLRDLRLIDNFTLQGSYTSLANFLGKNMSLVLIEIQERIVCEDAMKTVSGPNVGMVAPYA